MRKPEFVARIGHYVDIRSTFYPWSRPHSLALGEYVIDGQIINFAAGIWRRGPAGDLANPRALLMTSVDDDDSHWFARTLQGVQSAAYESETGVLRAPKVEIAAPPLPCGEKLLLTVPAEIPFTHYENT